MAVVRDIVRGGGGGGGGGGGEGGGRDDKDIGRIKTF